MRVQNLRNVIRSWISTDRNVKMCTARPGWQAMSLRAGKYKKTFKNIPLHNFNNIISIDESKGSCIVEPMCTMGQISYFLLNLGWTLPVVPELDDLTVGGLIAGVGIETSSHKYGLFQHVCLSFEIVLPDGSVITCSEVENPDFFRCIPWSHGTLGFVVAAEIRIIRSKPFVHLAYLPFKGDRTGCQKAFEEESRLGRFDFVECLAFSATDFVLMLGNMSKDIRGKESAVEIAGRRPSGACKHNPIGRWYKQWFFKHVEGFLAQGNGLYFEETIPLRDYYHRHSRSLFWEMQDIIPFGNHPLFRLLLGWTMPPKPALMKLTQTEALRRLYELHHVVQDMLVPIQQLDKCIELFDREIAVYPLWLCPFKLPANDKVEDPRAMGFVHPQSSKTDEMFVDVGAYGNPKPRDGRAFKAKETCRRLEEFVRSVKGYQMMYADSYMTKAEFREMFDHSLYDKLRESIPYCKDAFPEVYDKVCKAARI